ncbi:MAG: (Fe-S)-binding protein, partial [Gammaproteobacteria bacterium]|nr:(Fe-S)-binding protein [Gammaproteobacteria bacterium]
AEVPYGRLLDNGRGLLAGRPTVGNWLRLLLHQIITQPALLRLFLIPVKLAGKTGLLRLLGKAPGTPGRIARAIRIPLNKAPKPGHYPAFGKERGAVTLFLGCVAREFDAQTLSDSLQVLRTAGYSVDIPADQVCCGALDQHAGFLKRSRKLAERNVAALASNSVDVIITTATGCGAQLKDYAWILENDAGQRFAQRVKDISAFLVNSKSTRHLTIKSLNADVAVHTPCTQKHVLGTGDSVRQLLSDIPDLKVTELSNAHCCGGAGSYFLTQPEMADRLRAKTLSEYDKQQCDYLVTANVGCALHIESDGAGKHIAHIRHPVSLLAQQLTDLTDKDRV